MKTLILILTLLMASVASIPAADVAVTTSVVHAGSGLQGVEVEPFGMGVAGILNNGFLFGADYARVSAFGGQVNANSTSAVFGWVPAPKTVSVGPVGRIGRINGSACSLSRNYGQPSATCVSASTTEYGGGMALNVRAGKYVKPFFTVEYVRRGSMHGATARVGVSIGTR